MQAVRPTLLIDSLPWLRCCWGTGKEALALPLARCLQSLWKAWWEANTEYGVDTIEMHLDAIRPGARTLVIDDVLATGGTAAAAAALVNDVGGDLLGFGFLIELCFLHGRQKIDRHRIEAVLAVEG